MLNSFKSLNIKISYLFLRIKQSFKDVYLPDYKIDKFIFILYFFTEGQLIKNELNPIGTQGNMTASQLTCEYILYFE